MPVIDGKSHNERAMSLVSHLITNQKTKSTLRG
jgi:hypothetical protein